MRNIPLSTSSTGQAVQLTPARIALARTVDATISSSTAITFNAATVILRVYALDQAVYLKWGTKAVDATNFDEVIPANQIVDLVVPNDVSVSPVTRFTGCTVIEKTATAGIVVIEK